MRLSGRRITIVVLMLRSVHNELQLTLHNASGIFVSFTVEIQVF